MVLLTDTMGQLVLALVKLVLRLVVLFDQITHFVTFLTDDEVLQLAFLLQGLVVAFQLL